MKLLFVAVSLSSGGTSTVLKNIIPLLNENHEVTILTDNKSDFNISCHKLIKINTIPTISKYNLMPELTRMVKNQFFEQFDLIHIFEYTNFVADYLTYKKSKISPPIIISTHGTVHQNVNFSLKIVKKIHNYFMDKLKSRISYFIASSEAEKQHLVKHNFPEEKIKKIYLGIKRLEINRNQKVKKNILYVGRLTATKNIPILIQAFALCKEKNVDLIIAGPDDGMQKELQGLSKELKIDKRVFFKGNVSDDEKNELLANATMFIHPSLEDIFSLSLVEAAGAGVPCVVFNVEGNSEIFEDEKTGILVQEKNHKGLANTINNLLENPKKIEIISNNAKKIIPEKFNWNSTVKDLESCYFEAIQIKEKS